MQGGQKNDESSSCSGVVAGAKEGTKLRHAGFEMVCCFADSAVMDLWVFSMIAGECEGWAVLLKTRFGPSVRGRQYLDVISYHQCIRWQVKLTGSLTFWLSHTGLNWQAS